MTTWLMNWIHERGYKHYEVGILDSQLWVPSRDYLEARKIVEERRFMGWRVTVLIEDLP